MQRLVVAVVSTLTLLACSKKPEAPAPEAAPAAAPAAPAKPAYMAAFQALPDAPAVANADRVELGRMLYHERRISKAQDISCNSCHDLAKFGVDNEPTSPGFKGQRGGRNSPTTLNAALHVAQFWDGRAPDVEAQAKGPVLNPIEMAMADDKAVIAVLKSMPQYTDMFTKAFPGEADPVTYDNFAKAVGAFERQLITPSRLDKYVKGDVEALTSAELEGAKLFVETGCIGCHSGALLGGGTYMKAGAVRPREGLEDNGRFEFTKQEADRGFFKVPSLRNVDKTAPYFHDGSEPSLEGAVKKMASWQLGKDLTDAEASTIAAFLRSLTGEIAPSLVAAPELPPSTDKTPKPVLN